MSARVRYYAVASAVLALSLQACASSEPTSFATNILRAPTAQDQDEEEQDTEMGAAQSGQLNPAASPPGEAIKASGLMAASGNVLLPGALMRNDVGAVGAPISGLADGDTVAGLSLGTTMPASSAPSTQVSPNTGAGLAGAANLPAAVILSANPLAGGASASLSAPVTGNLSTVVGVPAPVSESSGLSSPVSLSVAAAPAASPTVSASTPISPTASVAIAAPTQPVATPTAAAVSVAVAAPRPSIVGQPVMQPGGSVLGSVNVATTGATGLAGAITPSTAASAAVNAASTTVTMAAPAPGSPAGGAGTPTAAAGLGQLSNLLPGIRR